MVWDLLYSELVGKRYSMFLHWKPENKPRSGFTFPDVLMAFVIMTVVMAGLMYGYVQINRMAVYSSMSLAAQSFASQGVEQAKSVQWNYVRVNPTNADATDPFWVPSSVGYTNLPPEVDTLDVPTTGGLIYITNFVTVTQVCTNLNPVNPPLRQISCTCIWALPVGFSASSNAAVVLYTNYAVTLRAPDQ